MQRFWKHFFWLFSIFILPEVGISKEKCSEYRSSLFFLTDGSWVLPTLGKKYIKNKYQRTFYWDKHFPKKNITSAFQRYQRHNSWDETVLLFFANAMEAIRLTAWPTSLLFLSAQTESAWKSFQTFPLAQCSTATENTQLFSCKSSLGPEFWTIRGFSLFQ